MPTRESTIIDARELRNALGHFHTGVTVVSYEFDGEAVGATVNAFSAVSLDPALLLVSLDNRSRAAQRLQDRPFAVNVLRQDQHSTALRFAGKDVDCDVRWIDDSIAPHLDGALAHFVCRPWHAYDGGDHTLFLGEVVEFGYDAGEPLTFFRGQFNGATLAA